MVVQKTKCRNMQKNRENLIKDFCGFVWISLDFKAKKKCNLFGYKFAKKKLAMFQNEKIETGERFQNGAKECTRPHPSNPC